MILEYINKRAIVTGATGGIGKAIIEYLIKVFEMQIFIVASHRSEEKVQEMIRENPDKIIGSICVDMQENDIAGIIDEEYSKCSKNRPEILINCAGISENELFMKVSKDSWNKHMQVNLHSTWQITQTVLRSMMKAKWGRIISIGSIVGRVGNTGQVAYATSKAAIEGMTKSLAVEVARYNITVNSIMPGFINTNMTAFLQEDDKKNIMNSILERIPMKKMGTPKDIAIAVEYLIKSDYVTGTSLEVSGGMCRF